MLRMLNSAAAAKYMFGIATRYQRENDYDLRL